MNVKICKLERKQGYDTALRIITITYKWLWIKWQRDVFLGKFNSWKFTDTTEYVTVGGMMQDVDTLLHKFWESGLDEHTIK